MQKLPETEYPRVRPLFDAPHLGYIVDSVIVGHTAADVWADEAESPRAAFMWDGVHGYYLAGDPSEAFVADLVRLLSGEIAPEAIRRNRAFFKVVCTPEAWEPRLPGLFAPVSLKSFPRTCFTLEGSPTPGWCERIPAGFTVTPIAADIISDPSRPNVEELLGEICQMWGAVEHFLADGFGWCALHGDSIAAWCTAEYLSPGACGPGACGLGVETVEEYQRRGLATVLACAALETARARGLRPHWDAWTGNTPSIRVAEKAGLTRECEYTAAVGSWAED